MKAAGVSGPVFVSIGDAEKMNVFLKNNPDVPRDKMFVDDLAMDGYSAVGFNRTFGAAGAPPKTTDPKLSFGQWASYLLNIIKLSPVPKGMKLGTIPEGVLRLGGTFVVNGDDVVYQWNDKLPGDHPNIGEVLTLAKEEAKGRGTSGVSAPVGATLLM